MASKPCIVRMLARLTRNIRAGTLPTGADMPDLADDWARIFVHTSDGELDAAVDAYLSAPSPWWPTPGQVLALAAGTEKTKAIEDGDKSAAARLFQQILLRRQSQGPNYRGPIVNLLEHEGNTTLEGCIQAAIATLGGWRALGMIEDREVQWRQKEFVEAFLAERAKVKADRKVAALTGAAQKALSVTS